MSDKACRLAIFFGFILWCWIGGGFVGGEFNVLLWRAESKAVLVFLVPMFAAWFAMIPIQLGSRP